MATMQKKTNLTVNTAVGKKEKPAQASPTGSFDSAVGFSPTGSAHTAATPVTPATVIKAQGTREQAPETPISIIVDGFPINAAQIEIMARELGQARANREFPPTTTPSYDVRATIEDHARLVHLRQVRGDAPREQWPQMRDATELVVSIAQAIRQRDSLRGEQVDTNNVHARIANMVRGCHGETNLYRLVQHAVHHAIQNRAVQHDVATGGVQMSAILTEIRDAVQAQAATGQNGVTEDNMELVLEQVFGMIEHGLLDAAGPIRVSANRLNNDVNRMDTITDAQQSLTAAQQSVAAAQRTQVEAIGTHVNAIGTNLNTFGTNLNTFGTNLNTFGTNLNTFGTNLNTFGTNLNTFGTNLNTFGTNLNTFGTNLNTLNGSLNCTAGNVQALGSQLNVLQTICNMLPEMVARAVQEILPQALNEAVAPTLAPIIIARLQERMGAMNGGHSTKGSGFEESTSTEKESGAKKQKKPGFFKRFFGGSKRGGFDDEGAAGGACY